MKAKVKARWVVAIPPEAKVTVKTGGKVEKGDLLASFKRHETERFDLSKAIGRLKREEWEEIRKEWRGKKVEVGQELGKKLLSPAAGIFVEIDEFGNMVLETISGETQKVYSPVRAKVVGVEEGKISIEFEAWRFEGEGLVGSRVWGEGVGGVKKKLSDLDWKDEERIVFGDNWDLGMLNKAEVIGVSGVVLKETGEIEAEKIDVNYPIIMVKDVDWSSLITILAPGKEYEILIDASGGKLLVV